MPQPEALTILGQSNAVGAQCHKTLPASESTGLPLQYPANLETNNVKKLQSYDCLKVMFSFFFWTCYYTLITHVAAGKGRQRVTPSSAWCAALVPASALRAHPKLLSDKAGPSPLHT